MRCKYEIRTVDSSNTSHYTIPTAMAYCIVIALLMVVVHYSDGGCHVNDWPHSCQANFRIGPQRCEPCESGSYGCNCSEPCPYGTYGQGCYHVCDCSDEQFCDPVVGCTNNTTTDITTATVLTQSSRVTLSSSSNTAKQHNPHTESGVTHLQSLTTSLIVSIMTVIVFSTICACILIRVSKQFYKREYRKLQNLWQSNESTAGDSNISSVYDYTASVVAPSSTVPPILDNNMYDQSDQSNTVSYNILSLRNFPSTINDYDEDCNSVKLPPRSKFSGCESEGREFDFDIEPECLLNLFKEEEGDKAPCRSSNPDIMQSELDREKGSYHSTSF
ncbi:uncharacterized protein [Magallana gigas]|uniref:uncharacterized protein n=1 Tax=Magallana gigas TaxID=29159 RepID=UPI00333E8C53